MASLSQDIRYAVRRFKRGTVSLLTFPDLGVAIAAAANVTDARGFDPFALQVAEVFTTHQNRPALPLRTGTASDIVSSSPRRP